MERSSRLVLVVIATLCIMSLQAQSQQGFISLDCGLPVNEESPYNESDTGLQFSSDAKFIQSGETGKVQATLEGGLLKPYVTMRYFPEGIRNCYNIPVEKGIKYLIKAWFIYGNYDGSDIKPNFDLYLGPNLWATVDMRKVASTDGSSFEEILHIPTSNNLQICLVKTGDTTPLISSLELRPLGKESYITMSGSLRLLDRRYVSNSTTFMRYPKDAYDRQWMPIFHPKWTIISTTSNVANANQFMPPKDAFKNAATPTNTNAPLRIRWSTKNLDDQYYSYEHLAEIQDLRANESRELMVSLNGEDYSDPIIPQKLSVTTIFSRNPKMCKGGECNFQLVRTPRSTLPPLLNAYEIYRLIHFPLLETDEDQVVAITSIKDTYKLKRINWQGDPCVPRNLTWDGLNCNDTSISESPRITSLNLSSSGLTGTIAAAIQNLTHLEKLDLSNNNLTGELPEFLGNMKSLLFINLSGNDLNGSIPQALQKEGLKLVILPGNPRLRQTSSSTKPSTKNFLVAIVASIASLAMFIAVLVLFLVLRRKKLSNVGAPLLPSSVSPTVKLTRSDPPRPLIEMRTRRFTYSDVINMTNDFQRVLGRGGFGQVYHGTLDESGEVAVKVPSGLSTHCFKQFKAEVELLLRVHHTNLVSLVGYCDEEDHLALIYEFVPNGNLKEHLSGKQGRPIIDWGMRLKIAVEAALGLEYLHRGCTPSMIHRDVKTENILLGEHFQAKLADFGLSRPSPSLGETHVSTVIAGTPGYLDPEYYETGWLSEKSDVYSFGIVLLEIITNKPVIDETRERSGIAEWVGLELNQGEITRIMDPKLDVDYNSPSVWNALILAMSCADPCSLKRPTMSQVVSKLKECLENLRGLSEFC